MAIGNGVIQYKSTRKRHIFRFPLSQVREAKKNDVYLSDLHAFHITLANGAKYDFVVVRDDGAFQPPDAVLAAIDGAMAGHPYSTATASTAAAQPAPRIVNASVMHDHGSAGNGHCAGFMTIEDGKILYKSKSGKHTFRFPLSEVSEAKKNEFYLSQLGAFHIRLANGTDYNFVALDSNGQSQPPDAILAAIELAMTTAPPPQ